MERHGFGHRLLRVASHFAIPHIERVRFRRKREIDRRFRQRQVAFRHAEKVDGLHRGDANPQGVRVGEADIL